MEEQSDGSVTVYLTQHHYSLFLSAVSCNNKPRVNVTITDITVEVSEGESSRVPLLALLGPTNLRPGAARSTYLVLLLSAFTVVFLALCAA